MAEVVQALRVDPPIECILKARTARSSARGSPIRRMCVREAAVDARALCDRAHGSRNDARNLVLAPALLAEPPSRTAPLFK